MKNKKIWPVILLIIIVVAAGIIIFNSTDTVRSRKQIDLGHRYLSEMNYEEAIVAFNQAIEIDSRNVGAYLGLADAYLGLGDEESALAALVAGYEMTGDEQLKERIDEMKASVAEEKTEISSPVMDSDEIGRRVSEIKDIVYRYGGPGSQIYYETNFLTHGQIEAAYRPLAEELEMYLEYAQGDWEEAAWAALSDFYCQLGEMEKCLEVRHRGYESTGWYWLMPETHESDDGLVFDKYGRMISGGDYTSITYSEAYRCIACDGITYDGYSFHGQLEYDSLGRIESALIQEESGEERQYKYQYQSDNSVMIVETIAGFSEQYFTIIAYDEYGMWGFSDMSLWAPME